MKDCCGAEPVKKSLPFSTRRAPAQLEGAGGSSAGSRRYATATLRRVFGSCKAAVALPLPVQVRGFCTAAACRAMCQAPCIRIAWIRLRGSLFGRKPGATFVEEALREADVARRRCSGGYKTTAPSPRAEPTSPSAKAGRRPIGGAADLGRASSRSSQPAAGKPGAKQAPCGPRWRLLVFFLRGLVSSAAESLNPPFEVQRAAR